MVLAAMVAFAMGPSLGTARAGSVPAAERRTGNWEGKLDSLPSAILKVIQDGGAVQGQASFNLIKRVESGDPTIAGTMAVAMVNPHVQGNDLRMENPPRQGIITKAASNESGSIW